MKRAVPLWDGAFDFRGFTLSFGINHWNMPKAVSLVLGLGRLDLVGLLLQLRVADPFPSSVTGRVICSQLLRCGCR